MGACSMLTSRAEIKTIDSTLRTVDSALATCAAGWPLPTRIEICSRTPASKVASKAMSAHSDSTDINISPIARFFTKDTGPPDFIAIAVPVVPLRRWRAELCHSLMFKAPRDLSHGGVFHFTPGAFAKNRGPNYECAGRPVAAQAPRVRIRAGANVRKATHAQRLHPIGTV